MQISWAKENLSAN